MVQTLDRHAPVARMNSTRPCRQGLASSSASGQKTTLTKLAAYLAAIVSSIRKRQRHWSAMAAVSSAASRILRRRGG